jgi:prepilin-type N-terminal cleavage/methylation domain-containing protein
MRHARTGQERKGRARGGRRGFTLIETALTTIIVGVGVLAIVAAQAAFHQKNDWSTHASIAMHLGNEIREMTLELPKHDPVTGTAYWGPEPNELFIEDFDDIDDFDGQFGTGLIFGADWDEDTTDNGPINARRAIISNMEGWSQVIRVYNVDSFDLTDEELDAATSTLMVEVTIGFALPDQEDAEELTRVSWLVPN